MVRIITYYVSKSKFICLFEMVRTESYNIFWLAIFSNRLEVTWNWRCFAAEIGRTIVVVASLYVADFGCFFLLFWSPLFLYIGTLL